MKSLDGSLLISYEDQLRRWTEHFATVWNRVFASDMLPNQTEVPEVRKARIRTTTPSKDKITTGIKALKNNKVVGLEGIPAELLRAAPTTSAKLQQPLIERAWEAERFPDEWKKGMIVKLLRKEM